jgi:DNA-binding response OmpR family regulator
MLNSQIDSSQSNLTRILIVDEDERFLDEIIATLTFAGFDCQGCRTIESAIVAADAQRPDLILTAVHVQGVPGMEICRHVRENCDRTDLPVMFLSATQMPDIIRRRDDGHGIYYLRRMLKRNVLLELIDKVLPATSLAPSLG